MINMRRLKVVAVLFLVGFAVVSGCRVYRRAKTFVAHSVPQSVRADVIDTKATPITADRPITGKLPMAEAFETGQLPEPLPVPAGDPDKAAEELARKIAAKDEQSTAALLTGLQLAGFSIRNPQGEISLTPHGASQGMAFDAFSVAAMAKLYSYGWHMSLADLSVVLNKGIPESQKFPVSEILAAGIAASTRGEQPLRFWSRLIVELGKHASRPYDLSSGNVDPSVELDSIQTSLILQRLYGDLMSHAKAGPPPKSNARFQRADESHIPLIQPAVFHPGSRARLLLASQEEGGNPCESEWMKIILDANAIFKTTEWEKFINIQKLEAPGWQSYANAVLTILKFVWVYASMHVDVKMDADELVRSYNLEDSATQTLTARVWFKIDNWSLLNCLRPALNLGPVKLDFGNLPNNGAAKGVGVAWRGLEGFAPSPIPIELHNNPAGLLAYKANALVFFNNGPGDEGDPSSPFRKAGPDGKASIKVTGNRQPKDLTYEKRVPVMKEMSVAVDVKYKQVSEVGDMLSEFLDVLGPAVGIASGDLPAGLISALTETIFRMHWNIDGVFPFKVKDWKPCDGGWSGTVTFIRTLQKNNTGTLPTGVIQTNAEELKEIDHLSLDGPSAPGADDSIGTWSAESIHRTLRADHSSGGGRRNAFCHYGMSDSAWEDTTAGSGKGDASFLIYSNDTTFHFAWVNGNQPFRAKMKSTYHYSGQSDCEVIQPVNRMDESDISIYPFAFTFSGPVDPKDPDHFSGSISDAKLPGLPDDGSKISVIWDLCKCKKYPPQ